MFNYLAVSHGSAHSFTVSVEVFQYVVLTLTELAVDMLLTQITETDR